LSCVQPFVRP